jgi:magnesium-transporting ATPase (P-type)
MEILDQKSTPEIKATPIGGWLWVVMIVIIASGLQILISIITITTELLADDWNLYVHSTDELLRTRINIYVYLILSMVIGLVITVWSLVNFFQRKKRFPAIFLGLLGYFILTEVLRIYFLNYYAVLSGQDASTMESGLAKTGIVAILAGLYLHKGKRPIQTFVN